MRLELLVVERAAIHGRNVTNGAGKVVQESNRVQDQLDGLNVRREATDVDWLRQSL